MSLLPADVSDNLPARLCRVKPPCRPGVSLTASADLDSLEYPVTHPRAGLNVDITIDEEAARNLTELVDGKPESVGLTDEE